MLRSTLVVLVVVMVAVVVAVQPTPVPASQTSCNIVDTGDQSPHQVVIKQTNSCGRQEETRICPYPFTSYGSDCFFLSTVLRNWDEARHYCRGLGGDLINPNKGYISFSLIQGKPAQEWWIGGRYSTASQRYEDVTSKVELDLNMWHPTLPQARGPTSACVYFHLSNQRPWANYPCTHVYRFICQY